jgi:hypothetical protein
MPFVVDASILAAWLLPDEAKPDTDALLERVIEERPRAPIFCSTSSARFWGRLCDARGSRIPICHS